MKDKDMLKLHFSLSGSTLDCKKRGKRHGFLAEDSGFRIGPVQQGVCSRMQTAHAALKTWERPRKVKSAVAEK